MARQSAENDTSENIQLEAILSELRKHLPWMIGAFVVIFAAVFAATYFRTPKYTASTAVLIADDGQSKLTGTQENTSPADSPTIDSEVELLKSNAVANRVVRSLQLENDAEFSAGINKAVQGKIEAAGPNPKVGEDLKIEAIADRVMGGLDIKRQGLTRVIKINYTSTSKTKAAKLANAWAKAYIEEKIATREAANQQANGWLSERIESLRAQVEQTDRAVQEYKIRNNLLSATGSTLTEQEISDLNRQLASVQVDRAEASARLNTARRQMQSGSTGDDVGEALKSPVVSSLRTQAAQLSARLAELDAHYGPQHPEVIKAKNQLADVNTQIQAEIRRVISNLEAQDQIQAQRAGSIAGSVRRAQGQLASNSQAMVKLNELELQAQSVRQLYESYLDRFKQTATQSGLKAVNAQLVAPAAIPTDPSSPKLALSLALGFVAGVFGAGGTALVRRGMEQGLTTSKDVENKLGVKFLASIADLQTTLKDKSGKPLPHRYIIDKPLSVFAEGFRNLRAAILYAPNTSPKIIAVTSALPGEGKTTTSVCLGAAFATAGNSVIVVDCDLRKRSLNAIFNQSPEKGLVELLNGEARLDEVIMTDDHTKITYLPLSVNKVPNEDIYGTPEFDKLLEVLRKRYDYVILDTAPVLPVADTRILARKADFVMLLVRWRKTPARAVEAAVDILDSARVTIHGATLTQVNINAQAKYGYGDAGYYYKEYKSYYLQN
ncbi:polysaccharide biosynthesis tyrosine autokinase [Asticcacaulis sp.]|uniref:GumC family protein n=1 Tax=Asticcacaulis sp. TaxID=1872648 RepID=UPI0031D63922